MRLQLIVLVCSVVLVLAIDEERSKPGSCPVIDSDQISICSEECTNDVSCPGTKKCCSNGCGHTCQEPPKVKPGQCPLPNGDVGTCSQSCRSDADCYANTKCCHNGCGTECMELSLQDAQGPCRFAQMMVETAIASMGPKGGASDLYVPRCDADGSFHKVQCDDRAGLCWCANTTGTIIPDTLKPNYTECDGIELAESCTINEGDPEGCRNSLGDQCKYGFAAGNDGCPICQCYLPCDGYECPTGSVCKPMHVLCSEGDCPGIPQCVPEIDESVCPEDKEAVHCLVDPCASATCAAHPMATCKTDYCGHCKALFYDTNNNVVNCEKHEKFRCPEQEPDIITTCENACGSQDGCLAGKLCCSVGCRRECLDPVPIGLTSCQLAAKTASVAVVTSTSTSSAAQLERYIPRCLDDGRYEQIQCAEHIGVCWCVDPDTGVKIGGTQIRGNPDCAATGTEDSDEVSVCAPGTEMQRCAQNMCYQAACLAHPAAVCRVNPCGECTVEFYDESNTIVDCNKDLTPCQAQRQTALNSNNRGVLSSSLLKNITDKLPGMVQDVINQLGGVCGIPTTWTDGQLPGIGRLEDLPNVDDIFRILFGEGDSDMPSLDDLTDAIGSIGGDLADATSFGIDKIFDHLSTIGDFLSIWFGNGDDDSRRRREVDNQSNSKVLSTPLFGPYIPECTESGAFSWKQCHGNTGVCWCIDADGNPMLDTVTTKPASKSLRCYQEGKVEGTGEGEQFTCPNGEQMKLCLDISCSRESCPGNPDAFCVIDPCNNCQETWKTCDNLEKSVDCGAAAPGDLCPADKPAQICLEDLCATSACRWNHCARCRMDVCGGCTAKFYDDQGREVNCEKPVSRCMLSSQCASGLLGSYKPQCAENGRFNPMQCHPSTGFCWCVDEAGVEVPDTQLRGEPVCDFIPIGSVEVSFTIRSDYALVKDDLSNFKEVVTDQLVKEFHLPDSKMIQNLEVTEGSIEVSYNLVLISGSNTSVSDVAAHMESRFKSGTYKVIYKDHELTVDSESADFAMQQAVATSPTTGSGGGSGIIIAVVVIVLIVCVVGAVVGYLIYRRQCSPNQSTAKYMRSENGPEVSFSTDTYSLPAPENA